MPRKPDTRTRSRVLAAIRRNPGASYRELASMVGLNSPSVISYHVQKLKDDGLISRGDCRSHRTTTARPETSAKKSAGGRKARRILEQRGNDHHGIRFHSSGLRCSKLG